MKSGLPLFCLAVLGLVWPAALHAADAARPNVLFIVADDKY
jgi:hypothetical protein